MLAEWGHYALILALALAVLQVAIPLWGCWRQHVLYMSMARALAYAQCVFISIAFVSLALCFLRDDFSVRYVAEHSNTLLPAIYRFCAVWGAHEGSMLLWVWTLSVWMAAVAKTSRQLPLPTMACVLAILAMISVGFLLFILLTSNPFLRLLPLPPLNGLDLNPLLQDPGLVSHPPMLYMGYVGFSVAFAFAVTALVQGRLDVAWVRWSRPWTLAAWCFLTLGITMGSWWSYHQLGWGGWWFWDPVENASFLPWLAGTALLHSLAVAHKRHAFKGWSALLAIAAFSLSLVGTFLVRSGVLVSVHAFAVDPGRGLFMLAFIAVVVGGSLVLYAWRVSALTQVVAWRRLSKETLLLLNNVLLAVMLLTVLLGTLYPLLVQVLDWGKISVGVPYFNTVFVPLLLPLLLLMGFAPHCRWHGDTAARLWHTLKWPALTSVCVGVLLPWWLGGRFFVGVAVGMSLVCWIVFAGVYALWQQARQRGLAFIPAHQWGMVMAHIGLAVCATGVILSQAYGVSIAVRMAAGDATPLAQYQLRFERTQTLQGPNYTGLSGYFTLWQNHVLRATLHSDKRIFTVGQIAKTQAAIRPAFVHDIYVVLGDQNTDQTWVVRAYYKPFVRWIWGGGIWMLLGGVWAMCDRRYRLQRRPEVAA